MAQFFYLMVLINIFYFFLWFLCSSSPAFWKHGIDMHGKTAARSCILASFYETGLYRNIIQNFPASDKTQQGTTLLFHVISIYFQATSPGSILFKLIQTEAGLLMLHLFLWYTPPRKVFKEKTFHSMSPSSLTSHFTSLLHWTRHKIQRINEQLHSYCLPGAFPHVDLLVCFKKKNCSCKLKHECVLKTALLKIAQPTCKNSCNLAHASSSAQSASQVIISTQQELGSQFVTVRSWGRLFLLYVSIYNKYSIACHGKDVEHIYTSNLPFHIQFINLFW